MGIYDRDYIRSAPSGRRTFSTGPFALRAWSMTTWLIALCVVMFATDALAPESWYKSVEIARQWLVETPPASWGWVIDSDAAEATLRDNPLMPFDAAIVDSTTHQIVGKSTYQWMPPLKRWFHFSTTEGFLRLGLWRLIGFQFLHHDLMHILFNMIALYFFGPLVEGYLGRKRFLAFYLLCGIFGALTYLVLNLGGFVASELSGAETVIPGLLFNDTRVPLVGASAGVYGVLMAGAFIAPRERVYVFFVLPVELRPLSYLLVAMAFITLVTGGPNAGGDAGHIGGALAGAYFIRRTHHLHGFFDFLGRVDPTSSRYRPAQRGRSRSNVDDRAVDQVLDKLREHGLGSLTDDERRILREASRRHGA